MVASESPPPGPTGLFLDGWDTERKLREAAVMAVPKLPTNIREQFAALISSKNLAITAGVFGFWVGSQAFGIGEFVDIGLVIVGYYSLGAQAFGAGQDLGKFIVICKRARTKNDLELASTYLARAVTALGVVAFAAMVTKGSGKAGAAVVDPIEEEYPLMSHPRLLAKHPGPVEGNALRVEVKLKGFRRVPKSGASEIYVRRIVENEKVYFEAVRIDTMRLPKGNRNAIGSRDAGLFQAIERQPRQVHLSMASNDMPSQNAQVKMMQEGKAFKGDFSHWHHERFLVSSKETLQESLRKYLEDYTNVEVKMRVERFDTNGHIVRCPPQEFDKADGHVVTLGPADE